ncbi:MAG: host attachment protein [Gammaproteobacteria bacterium]|nr:MAG: host attachment protein [Gammaproteobacteria bacterium]
MIWVISLNSSLGHIYSYKLKNHELILLKSLENPSAKLKESDLVSDRPGHYQTMHSAKGAYEASTSPHDVELDHFTKILADFIKKGLDTHQYKQLILCSAPHVGGILLNNLDKQVEKTILVNIKKNFVEEDESVLSNYLKENWWDIIRSNKI